MLVVQTAEEYAGLFHQWSGRRIALVPTMGALHEGHAALIRHARKLGDIVIVSIFVNPLQFGPKEDFSRYPRPIEADLLLCRELGVDLVFQPTVETMYPDGLETVTTVVPPASLTDNLCGEFRPGHFTGVATVVLKLLNIIRPHWAVFGEKDAQQLMVIHKMVRDLQLPVEIVAHPTVRDESGLALSSRNRYLQTEAERTAALSLYKILQTAKTWVAEAQAPLPAAETLAAITEDVLNGTRDQVRIQYLQAVDNQTFHPADTLKPGTRLLIAAHVGNVRLIDNLEL